MKERPRHPTYIRYTRYNYWCMDHHINKLLINNLKPSNIVTGYLLRKIVTDTEHKINHSLIPQERKMFLYSGHENNIASMLELFNLREFVDVPPYGSQVLIEVHNINNTYKIKVSL